MTSMTTRATITPRTLSARPFERTCTERTRPTSGPAPPGSASRGKRGDHREHQAHRRGEVAHDGQPYPLEQRPSEHDRRAGHRREPDPRAEEDRDRVEA